MKRHGFTLTELIVVIAAIILLATLALPAVRALQTSFESGGSINTINAALTMAKAKAEQTQNYTGIRFQKDADGDQYMIMIAYRPDLTEADDPGLICTTIVGHKPMWLGRYSVIAEDSNSPTIIFAPNGQLCRRLVVVINNPDFPDDTVWQQSQIGLLVNNDPNAYFVNRYTGQLIGH